MGDRVTTAPRGMTLKHVDKDGWQLWVLTDPSQLRVAAEDAFQQAYPEGEDEGTRKSFGCLVEELYPTLPNHFIFECTPSGPMFVSPQRRHGLDWVVDPCPAENLFSPAAVIGRKHDVSNWPVKIMGVREIPDTDHWEWPVEIMTTFAYSVDVLVAAGGTLSSEDHLMSLMMSDVPEIRRAAEMHPALPSRHRLVLNLNDPNS